MMKRIVLTMVVGIAAIALISTQASAQVSGVCSSCHTMHYSQGGAIPTGAGTTGPYETLLLNDCLGCHTTDASDPLNNTDGTPYVMSTNATGFSDTNCLAGGFFTAAVITDNNSSAQHDLGSMAAPAGSLETVYDNSGGSVPLGTSGLRCAGANGCHGDQAVDAAGGDMEAVAGGHHNTAATYRMLYVGSGNPSSAANGVDGVGASDYEETLISGGAITNRNIYSAGAAEITISELCAKCHGDFHNEGSTTDDCGAASPWVRHPTDVDIPTAWDIATDALTASDYINNPVGWTGGAESGTRRATCLSCHRAHGTQNDDLLRWAYSTQEANSATVEYGCLGCHDAQRLQP